MAEQQDPGEVGDRLTELAHELRSPLAGVRAFAGALRERWEQLDDATKLALIDSIKADADRLDRLVSDLLLRAHIDDQTLVLSRRPVLVVPLLRQLVDSAQATTTRRVVLRTKPDTAESELVVDPDRFAQVISNLLANAVEHGQGEVAVEVVRAIDQGLPRCDVRVIDEGPGLAVELAQATEKGWSSKPKGGGWGLFIASGIVAAHGGELLAEVTEGGNHCLTTRWPLDQDPAPEMPLRHRGVGPGAETG